MKHVDVEAVKTNPAKRLEFLQEYVAFNDDDWRSLGESVEVLGSKLPGLLDALYDHLLGFDDTRRIFMGARESVDPNYIALRKEHLTEWILKTIQGVDDKAQFAKFMNTTALRHSGVSGEPGRVVPPRYLVGLTAVLQAQILSILFDELPHDSKRARKYAVAWNKMLMIQLEFFLKALVPLWIQWDEA